MTDDGAAFGRRSGDDRFPGHIDRITANSRRLTVEGWTLAGRVTLSCGGRQVSARPDLPRRDLAGRLGGDEGASPRVGYALEIAVPGPGPALLMFEPSEGQAGATQVMVLPDTTPPAARPDAPLRAPRWMRGRLGGLFRRYAAQHLDISGAGPALRDAGGRVIGNIDRIRATGSHLSVEGWANARLVVLEAGRRRRTTEPRMPRPDVTEATGLPAELGFFLDIPRGAEDDSVPVLRIDPHAGRPVALGLAGPAGGAARRRLIRGFLVQLARLLPAIALWRLTGDPRHRATIKRGLGLTGLVAAEPLDPALLSPPDDIGTTAEPPLPRETGVTIVLPVYNAFDLLPEVLDRVQRHTDLPFRLVVIEDASPDARVRPFLRDWAARVAAGAPGRVELIENAENLGFIGSVNRGLDRARAIGDPVVLLNSDAFVPAGWASRLLRPLLESGDVASVTPMSNDAEIFTVPAICTRTPLAPGMADAIDAAAARLAPGPAALAEAPTGVGFCMALSPAFLRKIPELDPAFGRGYGEEVDWCQKARALGGRHLGLARLFVEHRGGESFGSDEKLKLVAANNARIARRYPGYDQEVQTFIAADPMATARLALTVAWMAAWAEEGQTAAGETGEGAGEDRRVPLYLAHTLGGGADSYLQGRIAADLAATGRPALILRVGGARRWRLEAISPAGTTIGETDDFDLVERILAPLGRAEVVYSCGVGDPDPAELPGRLLALARTMGDAPVEVLFHDFFPLSPSYTLLDGDGRYRGPLGDAAARADDAAHAVRRADGRRLDLAGWQDAWRQLLERAARLVVFSEDSRRQIRAALPDLDTPIAVRPHRLQVTPPALGRPRGDGPRVIAALGNIGHQKGAGVLRDLALRMTGDGTPRLVLLGNIDPAYALPAHVPVHGSYRVADLADLAAQYGVTDWLIPSIWPETFSYTTHEALATGLPVWAFALGAQGDAVTAAQNGHAVPLGPEDDPAERLFAALTGGAEGDAPENGRAALTKPA